MVTTGEYRQCYVAFLDMLGFGRLVDRGVGDPELVRRLSGITTLAAVPKSGFKETSLGRCEMQVRAFSDSIAIFTPTELEAGNQSNSLAQLCFVTRFLHDRIMELGVTLRGGLTAGGMYWHPGWSTGAKAAKRGTRGAMPITFGPGLNTAYDLERHRAIYPRILVDETVQAKAAETACWPFAEHGAMLQTYMRRDLRDGKVFLDLLNARVIRVEGERMHPFPAGFTITWDGHNGSAHSSMIRKVQSVAQVGIHENAACMRHREKHEWLLAYANECVP